MIFVKKLITFWVQLPLVLQITINWHTQPGFYEDSLLGVI